MKILIITASLNERSGWGRHARAIVDELRAQGAEVVVCALPPRLTLAAFIRNMVRARSLARPVEVVHALDGWPLGVYGWGAVLGTGKKLFINGVGTYSVAPLYARGKRWLMRRVYSRAQKIFCISTYTMDQMARAGVPAEKMLVVHFGTPQLPVPRAEDVQAYREARILTPDRHPLILTVGAIKDRKGQFDTLRAVGLLKERYPTILYIVAGAPDQPSYLAQMRDYAQSQSLTSNVLFLTDADDREIALLYSISSVFALNSTTDTEHHHFEGFGAVVTEAYQFGVPAVGSSDSGIEDAICDGETGYLTRQGDPENIAEKIERVLQNRAALSEQARHFAEGFAWEKTVSAYLRHYTGN